MDNKQTSSGGLGIGVILFLIFLVLKLAKIGEVADWSWLWVTSPLWIPLALAAIIILFALLVAFIDSLLK